MYIKVYFPVSLIFATDHNRYESVSFKIRLRLGLKASTLSSQNLPLQPLILAIYRDSAYIEDIYWGVGGWGERAKQNHDSRWTRAGKADCQLGTAASSSELDLYNHTAAAHPHGRRIHLHLVSCSAANRLIGEVVQSRRRPLLGPSPDWKRLLPLSHRMH